jgi:OOP family OmpA-OmpF porin
MSTLPPLALLALACAASFPAAAQETNLLALANGTLPVVEPATYASWPVVNLIDEAGSSGWAGTEAAVGGQAFVFELQAPATIDRFEFGTECIDGDGRGAKRVRVSVSATSAQTGFTTVAEAALAERQESQKVPAKTKVAGRWVRLELVDNHGDTQWIELCSFRGYGARPANVPTLDVAGTYTTDYGDFHLRSQGQALIGCYEHDGGLLSGSVDGRVLRLTWQEEGGPDDAGPAVMVLDPSGKSFTGFWWTGSDKDHGPSGSWDGIKKSAAVGSCPHWGGSVRSEVERQLTQEGRARIYGIEFDVDSATLRASSGAVLDELVKVLTSHADWKVSIEGHTDSSGTAAHNQELSQRRASSVRDYLTAHGITAPRLTASGFGATRPIGDNATELGRARNRRVEVVKGG